MEKNGEPAQRRDAVRWAQASNQALVVERTGVRYRPRTAPDTSLRRALRELAQDRPAFGHKRLHVRLQRAGLRVAPQEGA